MHQGHRSRRLRGVRLCDHQERWCFGNVESEDRRTAEILSKSLQALCASMACRSFPRKHSGALWPVSCDSALQYPHRAIFCRVMWRLRSDMRRSGAVYPGGESMQHPASFEIESPQETIAACSQRDTERKPASSALHGATWPAWWSSAIFRALGFLQSTWVTGHWSGEYLRWLLGQ